MRVAFAGTPPFAARALERLLAAGHEMVGVLTQPDRPAGRGLKLHASAVKQLALQHHLPVWQPRSLRLDGRWPDDAAAAREQLLAVAPEVMVVAAYGLILPAWALQLPRYGCINIHGSLLPRWRGAAPIQRAIEAGDTHTGVTIMQMDEGLDTGDMLLTDTLAIGPDDSSDTLLHRLADLGAGLVVEALERLQRGALPATPQPAEGVSYAHKIDKSEAAIDWRQSAAQIERRLRAFDPFPGALMSVQGQAVKLWRAQAVLAEASFAQADPGTVAHNGAGDLEIVCGSGRLRPLELQPPGGRRMPVDVFLQTPTGRLLVPGQVLAPLPTAG